MLTRWELALIGMIALVWSVGYLKLFSRWWYEDDPGHLYRIMQTSNPFAIFFDRTILRGFGIGQAMVPMQLLSLWVDARLLAANSLLVYTHTSISFAITCIVFAALLYRLTTDRAITLLGTLLFMALPTTMAVHLFIAARHYLEGFLFLTLTIWLVIQHRYWPALVVGAMAALFKETYAAMALMFLFTYGAFHREWRLISGSLLLGIFYFFYRYWALGFSITYSERPLLPGEIGPFLYGLAYSLTAYQSGVVIALVTLLLVGVSLTHRMLRTPLAIGLLVTAAALVSILPVATAVVVTYQTPGTWYRVPFIIAAVAVVGLTTCTSYLMPRTWAVLILILAIALTLPGTERTRQYWNEKMASAEREGHFYLDNPNKLLYSEEDAWWFIRGIHELYGVAEIHYINKGMPSDETTGPALLHFSTIWRYQAGEFQPDQQLYDQLREQLRSP